MGCIMGQIPFAMSHACRYSRDRPRMTDPLEVVKFMCKEFWIAVFKKQVDNLRTNHRVRQKSTLASAGLIWFINCLEYNSFVWPLF